MLPFTAWWGLVAWPWLKKNWYWVLFFPAGLVVLWLRLTRRSEKPVEEVTTSTMAGAAKVQEEATEKANSQLKAAKIVRDERIEEIQEEHVADVEEIAEQQRAKAKELQKDPAKANEFLMGVGKEMRRD